MGAGGFLRELGVTRVTELDWWQESKHTLQRPGEKDRTYTITAVPVMVSICFRASAHRLFIRTS